MAWKPGPDLIRRQSIEVYGVEITGERATELAAEVGRMLAGAEAGPPGGLDQDPFAFAAVLRALKEPGG
ncbi:MAG: hypothetical protein WD270_12550 [Acetobacterales bacterium]